MTNALSKKQTILKESLAIAILLIYTRINLKTTKYKNTIIKKLIDFSLNKIIIVRNIIIGLLYLFYLSFLIFGLLFKIYHDSTTLAISVVASGLLYCVTVLALLATLVYYQWQVSKNLIALL